MDEYTPTTERVRQRWLEAYEYERDMPGRIRRKYPDEVLAQFDRWLAEHDGEKDAQILDLESRLADLLCDLTNGRMSGTGYSVRTMVQEVEAAFDRYAQENNAETVDRLADDIPVDLWATYGGMPREKVLKIQEWVHEKASRLRERGTL